VFFVKDRGGALSRGELDARRRCGFNDKAALLGKRRPSFSGALAARYERRIKRVLTTGKPCSTNSNCNFYPRSPAAAGA